MLKDVTLGQYFPGQTPIHKLDPRTKLVFVILYIVVLFLAKWFVSYLLVAAFLGAVIWSAAPARRQGHLRQSCCGW